LAARCRRSRASGSGSAKVLTITQAAFDAIIATMLLGSVNAEAKTNAEGERLIWLDVRVVDRLTASSLATERWRI
jgi:hypothetical protein